MLSTADAICMSLLFLLPVDQTLPVDQIKQADAAARMAMANSHANSHANSRLQEGPRMPEVTTCAATSGRDEVVHGGGSHRASAIASAIGIGKHGKHGPHSVGVV